MTVSEGVIDWLLDADPAIRWQVRRDLMGAPEVVWAPERARVETEGWGARLLTLQDPDGQWAGGAFFPAGFGRSDWEAEGQPWTTTAHVLNELRQLGLDPASASARRTVALVGANSRWDEGGQPFWSGEVEECINGRTVADGAYFGADVGGIVARLLGEIQPDGGWNCERVNGSRRSSYHTTINVLEGLLAFERAGGGSPELRAARAGGEAFLLERDLFRRRSTGAPADPKFLSFTHPGRWHYGVLRALDYFRAAALHAGTRPDPRLAPAIEHLRARRGANGRWPLDWQPRGRVWFEMEDGAGQPSRWITLRALRVLTWWEADAG